MRNNAIFNSDNPQDQRKDNLRFDYRLNQDNQLTYRYSKYNWVAIDAFRGTFPFARTDWDRPNSTQNINWTRTFGGNLINEFSYSYSIDQVFINVFTESGLYKRSRTGHQLPLHLPGQEGDRGQDSECHSRRVHAHRRWAVSLVVGRADPRVLERDDLCQGPAHVQGWHLDRVLGRRRLRSDQRQLDSGRHEQPERPVLFQQQHARRGRGVGIADMALGLFTNYAEIGERAFTKWRALATDIFIQDSWKPTQQPDHRRWRTLGDVAAVVFARRTTSRTSIRASTIPPKPRRQPGDGPAGWRRSLQRHLAAGRRVRGRRQRSPGRAGSAGFRRSSVASREGSRTRTTTRSSRARACRTRSTRRRSHASTRASSTTASRSTTRRCSAATRRSSRW